MKMFWSKDSIVIFEERELHKILFRFESLKMLKLCLGSQPYITLCWSVTQIPNVEVFGCSIQGWRIFSVGHRLVKISDLFWFYPLKTQRIPSWAASVQRRLLHMRLVSRDREELSLTQCLWCHRPLSSQPSLEWALKIYAVRLCAKLVSTNPTAKRLCYFRWKSKIHLKIKVTGPDITFKTMSATRVWRYLNITPKPMGMRVLHRVRMMAPKGSRLTTGVLVQARL